MKLLLNHIFVCFDRENDEIETASGRKLSIVTCYEENKHTVTTGIVMGTPKGLFFKRGDNHSLQYDTDMELMVGDRIIFDFLAYQAIIKSTYPTIIDGKECYPMKYDGIYVAIRNGEIIPVNGVILVEPLVAGEQFKKFETPDYMKKDTLNTKGVVRYKGTPIRKYYTDQFMNTKSEIDERKYDVNVGDTIHFNWFDSVQIQFDLHQIIEKGTPLYQMKRKDIMGVAV